MLQLFSMKENINILAKTSSLPKKRFSLTGKVLKTSLDKTITVEITKKMRHPVYQKVVSRSKRYLVHDPENRAHINDWVEIISSRKFSKRKFFVLLKILKTAVSTEEK